MLLGKDFRRCHDTSLVAVVEGNEHRHQSHQSLATAHVTLQQAVHLPAGASVLTNLTDDPFLCLRQLEGQVVMIERIEIVTYLGEHIPPVFTAMVTRIP